MAKGSNPEVDTRSASASGKEGLGQESEPKVKALGAAIALLIWALAGCSRPETSNVRPAVAPAPEAATRPAAQPAPRPAADVATAVLLRETAALHRQGHHREGAALLTEELKRDPQRPRLHYNLGIFRAALDEYEAAAAAFEEELARFPGHAESHRALAAAYSRLGRLEDSVAHFESCLASLPDDPACAFGLGRSLSVLGLFDQALPHLEHAAELRADAGAYAELAIVHRRLGDLERAAGAFAQALADDPSHLRTLLGYGQTLTALGRREDGAALLERHQRLAAMQDQLDAFERGRKQGQPPLQAYLDVARLHLEREDRAAAAALYEQAMTLDPEDPVPALELAGLYLDDGRTGDAERCVEHALAADPQNPGPRFYDGLVKLKTGDLEAAGQAFASSLERGGWPAAAFLDAGDALRDAGDLDRAAAAYLQAMRLEPENPLAHQRLALAAREHGDRTSAEQGARRAAELDPGLGDAWTLLGVLRFEAGDAAEAEGAFTKAIAAERMTLLRAGGVEAVLEDFPGSGEARELYRRLLIDAFSI